MHNRIFLDNLHGPPISQLNPIFPHFSTSISSLSQHPCCTTPRAVSLLISCLSYILALFHNSYSSYLFNSLFDFGFSFTRAKSISNFAITHLFLTHDSSSPCLFQSLAWVTSLSYSQLTLLFVSVFYLTSLFLHTSLKIQHFIFTTLCHRKFLNYSSFSTRNTIITQLLNQAFLLCLLSSTHYIISTIFHQLNPHSNGLDWSLLVKHLVNKDTHNSWLNCFTNPMADDAKAKHVSQVQD